MCGCADLQRKVKFPAEFDALDIVTDDLKEKLLPVSTKLKTLERDRAERRKVRKRTKVTTQASTSASATTDVVMADSSSSQAATHGSSGTSVKGSEAAVDGENKPVAGAELEDESVYRAREAKELNELVHPDLNADVGCSTSGLYDLIGMPPFVIFFDIREFCPFPYSIFACFPDRICFVVLAIVTHKGAAADAGHYIGFVKKSALHPSLLPGASSSAPAPALDDDDEDWYKFDDDKVSIFPREKLATLDGGGEDSSAYVLLYKTKALA